MRQGLRDICESAGDISVVAEATSGVEAVALWRSTRPDIVLMDLSMPGVDGTEAIRQITREAPDARIVAFTMYRSAQDLAAAVHAGARACLNKTIQAPDLIAAIQAVHRGESLLNHDR